MSLFVVTCGGRHGDESIGEDISQGCGGLVMEIKYSKAGFFFLKKKAG
jgi:hypothetical protein